MIFSLLLLLDEISKKVQNAQDEDPSNMRNRVAVVFNDWLRLFQHENIEEESLAPFIMQLHQQGILKDEEVSIMFFRVGIELSVEYYFKNRTSANPISYRAIHAFAKLVVLLIKYAPTSESLESVQVAIFSQVLNVAAMILVQSIERKNFLVQKPFGKFFTLILSELNTFEKSLQPVHQELLFQFR